LYTQTGQILGGICGRTRSERGQGFSRSFTRVQVNG